MCSTFFAFPAKPRVILETKKKKKVARRGQFLDYRINRHAGRRRRRRDCCWRPTVDYTSGVARRADVAGKVAGFSELGILCVLWGGIGGRSKGNVDENRLIDFGREWINKLKACWGEGVNCCFWLLFNYRDSSRDWNLGSDGFIDIKICLFLLTVKGMWKCSLLALLGKAIWFTYIVNWLDVLQVLHNYRIYFLNIIIYSCTTALYSSA